WCASPDVHLDRFVSRMRETKGKRDHAAHGRGRAPCRRTATASRPCGLRTVCRRHRRTRWHWKVQSLPSLIKSFPTAFNGINDLIWTVDQEVGGSSPPSCTTIKSNT